MHDAIDFQVDCRNYLGYAVRRSGSTSVGGAAPGWRVGIPLAKTNASMANTAKTASEARSPLSRACAFSSTIASASAAGTPASSSAFAQVCVGDEGNAAGQFDLRVCLDLFWDAGIVLDARDEGPGER